MRELEWQLLIKLFSMAVGSRRLILRSPTINTWLDWEVDETHCGCVIVYMCVHTCAYVYDLACICPCVCICMHMHRLAVKNCLTLRPTSTKPACHERLSSERKTLNPNHPWWPPADYRRMNLHGIWLGVAIEADERFLKANGTPE